MSHLTDEARAQSREAAGYITVPGNTLEELLEANPARRTVLKNGVATVGLLGASSLLAACGDDDNDTAAPTPTPPVATPPPPSFAVAFTPVAMSTADVVTVPPGYVAEVLFKAGDPVPAGAAGFNPAAGAAGLGINVGSAVTETWAGGNHDGMWFFPSQSDATRGLLVLNHEFPDTSILFPGGALPNAQTATAEERRVLLSAVGVSVIEITKAADGVWSVNRASAANKRYTGNSTINVSGGAAAVVGATVTGTLNNCANGFTPWGTYLTCEETTSNYFLNTADEDATQNGFGWVVEIDPFNPAARAVKRTSMGRFDHENVAFMVDTAGRIAFYQGDDSTPGCIYKFVPTATAANGSFAGNTLDTGTLYVARFAANGTGEWRALVQGENGLVAGAQDPGTSVTQSTTPSAPTTVNFANQADVLLNAKAAARVAGGTQMDRPEWLTVGPDRVIWVTLTNNSGRQVVDAANPRPVNRHGHIIKFTETGNLATSLTFNWEIFLLAGSPALASGGANLTGNINGDVFSSPDGLWVDPQNRLFAQTDHSVPGNSGVSGTTIVQAFGNNAMYYIDQATKRSSRFLVGPVGQEITGVAYPRDLTAYFINVQHPTGAWPVAGEPPRSSTIVVRRTDGKPVGA